MKMRQVFSMAFLVFQALSAAASDSEFAQVELKESQVAAMARFYDQPAIYNAFAEDAIKNQITGLALELKATAMAKSYGFSDMNELNTVSYNVYLIEPFCSATTGEYINPQITALQEKERVLASTTLTEEEKAEQVADLDALMASQIQMQFPGNCPLVQKYRASF